VNVEVVTDIREQSLCLSLGHDSSNDHDTSTTEPLDGLFGHGTGFDITELDNGDDLKTLLF
jgi:hypothetical protein